MSRRMSNHFHADLENIYTFCLGVVFAYAISDDELKPEDVCVLVKEVQLQHRAPIIDFSCASIDGSQLIKVRWNNFCTLKVFKMRRIFKSI